MTQQKAEPAYVVLGERVFDPEGNCLGVDILHSQDAEVACAVANLLRQYPDKVILISDEVNLIQVDF